MRKTYRFESNFTRRVMNHFYKSSARLLAFAFFSIYLLLPGGALAAQGDLDINFGVSGKVTTDIGGDDFIQDMVTLPDGRLVVVGFTGSSFGEKFTLACYTANGSLDPNFGQGGIVITQITQTDRAVAVTTQGNKIIVLGYSFTLDQQKFFSLARYDANGNLDPSFGNGGIVLTNIPGNVNETPTDVAVQNEDGRIVVVGTIPGNNSNAIAIRYLADGNMDASFGIGGIREISFQSGDSQASAVAIHNGKIIIGGKLNGKFLLMRLLQDGFNDPFFNVSGYITLSFPNSSSSTLSAIAVQADGKIVLAGTAFYPNVLPDFALARVSSSGFIDGNFGNLGRVVTDFDGFFDTGLDVTLQANGKIIVVGSTSNPSNGTNSFGVARYNQNGSLDQGFQDGGKIRTPFNDAPTAEAVIVKNDGNIVVAGHFINPANNKHDFALVSYLTVEPSFDIIVKNDATNRYLKINSLTGAYQFSDCDKGIYAEGIGSLSVKNCKLNFVGGGLNSSVSALVNPCTKQGNATVIVMMQGGSSSKTYQLNDTDITNNPNGCP
jgi:uncharacterized delta-60 repeat protein